MKKNQVKPEKMKVVNFLNSTQFVTNGIFLIGALITFIGIVIIYNIFGDHPPMIYVSLVVFIGLLLATVGSVMIILRREAPMSTPHLPSFKGSAAVLIGLFGVLIFGSMALIVLYNILFNLIE